MTKLAIFGTHPKQFNGYSKVVHELTKQLVLKGTLEVCIFGFQNFYNNPKHRTDIPPSVSIHDAFANEDPKKNGFGVPQVKDFMMKEKPDVVVVYNDMLVISQVVKQLNEIPNKWFKIIAYVDQVYLNQKKEFLNFINANVDVAMLFTPYWEKCIVDQGITVPTCYLQHGINPALYYPIPKEHARLFYGLNKDDFIILNLNRNQPRKRWDVCLKAFAEVVSRMPNEPIKLLIGTSVQGGWNLMEIYERELKKRNITMEVGMRHVIIMDNPQKVTDEDTNILYNVADIGINTCDGEGFGLCNFEQAVVGIPQIVPRLGGFMDFFDDACATLIDPKFAYYVDNSRDAVCGEALVCHYVDFADAIEAYYRDKGMRERHGKEARKRILAKYGWNKIADKLIENVFFALGKPVPVAAPAPAPIAAAAAAAETAEDINELLADIRAIDINKVKPIKAPEPEPAPKTPAPAAAAEEQEPAPAAAFTGKPTSAAKKMKKKGKKQVAGMDTKALLKLKQQLDLLFPDKS